MSGSDHAQGAEDAHAAQCGAAGSDKAIPMPVDLDATWRGPAH